jgi:predicted XRE-type DNA-binding protein
MSEAVEADEEVRRPKKSTSNGSRKAKMRIRPKIRKEAELAVSKSSGNVFADIGFSPKQAAELAIKAELTVQIYRQIRALGLTQTSAAARLGISQPDVSKLMRGRHTGYSVERLLALLNALEVDIEIILRPKPHRRNVSLGVVRVTAAAGAA